jgi:hypothetical protein
LEHKENGTILKATPRKTVDKQLEAGARAAVSG